MKYRVCVVGGGAAGMVLAHALARRCRRVSLIDKAATCKPTFKAEKLEPDQVQLLEKLGLMGLLGDTIVPIHGVRTFRRNRVVKVSQVHQFGMRYEDFVNTLREKMPATVALVQDEVTQLEVNGPASTATLRSGASIDADLAVLAGGATTRLGRGLGLDKVQIARDHTLVFGFDFAWSKPQLSSGGVNFWPDSRTRSRTGYLTLFPVPGALRANLFTYVDPQGEWAARLRAEPDAVLRDTFSSLERRLPGFHVTSKVAAVNIDLWTSNPARAKVVAVGDAFQSVCPATGTGLSKVLTDITQFLRSFDAMRAGHLPAPELVAHYYNSQQKQQVDRDSLLAARHGRTVATGHSPPAILARLKRDVSGLVRVRKARSTPDRRSAARRSPGRRNMI